MWAQIINTQLKPGKDTELVALMDQFKAAEQAGSGLLRSSLMRDQKDPASVYMMVVFDSEESARARENDPRRAEMLASVGETMAEIFDGPMDFLDLNVVTETTF